MRWYFQVLANYATFNGRAGRAEYWYFALFNLLFYLVAYCAGALVSWDAANAFTAVYGVAVLVPSLAVFHRRLHDTGRSGWWWLVGLIPLIGPVILLIFLVEDSEPGTNLYGPNPKAAGAMSEITVTSA